MTRASPQPSADVVPPGSTCRSGRSTRTTLARLLGAALAGVALSACATPAAEPATQAAPDSATGAASASGFSAGITVQPVATAQAIGLPIYPGAQLDRDKSADKPREKGSRKGADASDDDSPGADLNIWGGPFGMRLQVLKLKTPDSVEAVARYYRDEMARYGRVLDCGSEAAVDPHVPNDDKALRCDKERPKAGDKLLKVGTRQQMRIVSVEPVAGGARVQLLRLDFKRD